MLLNPAVDPARDPTNTSASRHRHDPSERFFFRAEFVEELRALAPPVVTQPQRYLAVIARATSC